MRIKLRMRQFRELASSAVVMAGAIVPMATVGHLKLDSAKRIQCLFSSRRPRAKNQNASLMIRLSRNMPHSEDESKITVISFRINCSAARAGAGHRAILHNPRVSIGLPAVESLAVEERGHPLNLRQCLFRKWCSRFGRVR